ncbi:MAG TPA: S8 family serine peptidase [Candidatus Eisenbacteria bacterium]
MIRSRASVLAVLALPALVAAPATLAAPGQTPVSEMQTGIETAWRAPGYVPDELIVKFKDTTTRQRIRAAVGGLGASLKQEPERDGLSFLKLGSGARPFDAVARFERLPEVEYAAPNLLAQGFFVPNDSVIGQFDLAWNLRNVGAYDAWDVVTGSRRVVLAIIDTGVAYEDHPIPDYERPNVWPGTTMYRQSPELPGPFRAGWDFVNDDEHPDDDAGHGTMVATIAAGAANNIAGSAGIASGVTLMPIKVLNFERDGEMSDIVQGIRFAADHGADIANLSLGFPPVQTLLDFGYPRDVLAHMFHPLRDAVNYARRRGTILVAASGNFASAEVSLPAGYPGVIAVGATGVDNMRASYSSFGKRLSFVAPGGDFLDVNGDHIQDQIPNLGIKPYRSEGSLAKPDSFNVFYFIGTSAAAPHVSGAVALLMSRGVKQEDEIKRRLRSTAVIPYGDPNVRSLEYGFGLVQIDKAVRHRGRGHWFRPDAAVERDPLGTRVASGNPGHGDVTLTFRTTQPGRVEASVYDARGRLVRTLTRGELSAGAQTVRWDGRDASGAPAASGIYFVRVETAEGAATRKLAYLR